MDSKEDYTKGWAWYVRAHTHTLKYFPNVENKSVEVAVDHVLLFHHFILSSHALTPSVSLTLSLSLSLSQIHTHAHNPHRTLMCGLSLPLTLSPPPLSPPSFLSSLSLHQYRLIFLRALNRSLSLSRWLLPCSHATWIQHWGSGIVFFFPSTSASLFFPFMSWWLSSPSREWAGCFWFVATSGNMRCTSMKRVRSNWLEGEKQGRPSPKESLQRWVERDSHSEQRGQSPLYHQPLVTPVEALCCLFLKFCVKSLSLCY